MAFRTEVPDIYMHLASAAVEKYFVEYSNIKSWIEGAKKIAIKNEYCVSPFGRVESLPDINSKHGLKCSESRRQAVNMPIQSAAADITIKAIINLDKWFSDNKATVATWGLVMINTVHDSIVFECNKEYAVIASEKIKEIMEQRDHLDFMKCPLRADIEIGDTYGTLEDLEDWIKNNS